MSEFQDLIRSSKSSSTLIVMTGEMLNQLIEDVRDNTKRLVEEQFQPKYYTVADLMEMFKVSQATIYKWMGRGLLHPYYMQEGGKPYFDQADINEQMGRGTIGRYVHK